MADWSLSKCERVENFNAVASRGAANTKGSYIQLTAASGFPYTAITLECTGTGGGGAGYLIDLAIGGAGSEQVIASNILFDTARGAYQNSLNITLPIAIPAGTRIAARIQDTTGTGTKTVDMTLTGRNGGGNYAPAGIGAAVTYGSDTATTNGVLVDAGATLNTYGVWTDIAAATSRDHAAIHAILGTNNQTGVLVAAIFYFQIGIGNTGNAVDAILCEFHSSSNGSVNRMNVNDFLLSQQIPEGTRIAMRSKCVLSGATGARQTTAIILGY